MFLSKMINNTRKIQNTDPLQLCDAWESSKYGAAQCYWLGGGCQGSYNSNCYPYGLWSGSTSSEAGSYHNRELQSGAYNVALTRQSTYAFSVRCVLDLKSKYRQVYSSVTQTIALLMVLHSA